MSVAVTALFQMVLKLSILGSYVIGLVLLARLLLQKAPKWCSYWLWAIVFLRLVCPVFPEAKFSLIPMQLEQISYDALLEKWESGIQQVDVQGTNTENEEAFGKNEEGSMQGAGAMQGTLTKEALTQQADISAQSLPGNTGSGFVNQENTNQANENTDYTNRENSMQENATAIKEADLQEFAQMIGVLLSVLSYLWLAVTLVLAGYHTYSYWKLKRKVRDAVIVEEGVREIVGEHLSFVMGILHPAIYLSSGLEEESRRVVLCHERVHLQRKDYLTKPIALGICCVHWFNPLVWLAFCLMNKDCEMSCDEKVVSMLGEGSKKVYSYALLDEASKGARRNYRRGSVCMLLSFGEDNVKNRISHVLRYKKASLWMIVAAVVVLMVLVIGLCSNPGSKPLTSETAVAAVQAAIQEQGGKSDEGIEDPDTICILVDFENDGKPEAFVTVGEKAIDKERIDGDMWFVSQDGRAEILLESKLLYTELEIFRAEKEEFLLVNYVDNNVLHTIVYGIREHKAERLISNENRKYVDGESIVCVVKDSELIYDIREKEFSGYDEKRYTYYYNGQNFVAYSAYEMTREEIEAYDNGAGILSAVESEYPNARFQYLARGNDWLHINIANREGQKIIFRHMTYKATEEGLVLLDEGAGCYRRNIEAAEEVSFTKEVAAEYGWETENDLAVNQITPESALHRFAYAFMDRDGDVLYQLSTDKENFEKWDMVIPLEGGGYAFGESSPWATEYDIEYEEGSDEATIRFVMSNSAPEHYITKEKVKLTRQGELYYVDHVDYKFYDEIDTRAELAEIYDLEAAVPFPNTSTGYYDSFGRIIFQHILEGFNPEYYSVYTDPVTSAKKLLHLGAGTGEVTEVLYEALNQFPVNPKEYGEGSVVNVRYTFAEDGSTVDIPMVLAEESEYIWLLSVADLSQIGDQKIGKLSGDNGRKVYAEFSDYNEDGVWENSPIGRFVDKGSNYQISSYGVYRLGYDMKCIYPHYIYRHDYIAVDFYEGKMYFPTDSQYSEEINDWMYDSICVIDLGTDEVRYIPLPDEAMSFPIDYIRVDEGFITLWNQKGSNYAFTLEDTETVWKDKKAVDLSTAEQDEFGAYMREQILEHPNTIVDVAIRTKNETYALIDMDGDGITERISMKPDGEPHYTPLDYFLLSVGETSESRFGENMTNNIWAFSPDGERIFIALYEDGPSGDPLTTIFKYVNKGLREAGTIENDIRLMTMENGVISTTIRYYVIQTDYLKVQYRLNEAGDLEEIPQETYDFIGLNDVELKKAVTVYFAPGSNQETRMDAGSSNVSDTDAASQESFEMTPQTIRILKTDSTKTWILLEGENGQRGWFDTETLGRGEVVEIFEGLSFAG